MDFELQQLLSLSGVNIRYRGPQEMLSKQTSSVSIDTRTLQKGELYLALKGENHDGHDFVMQAFEKGAVACVVSDDYLRRRPDAAEKPLFAAGSTLEVLQRLANSVRSQAAIPLVGLTGTNGKTTTKEMIASVLSQHGKVCKTEGNFNNHIGVPLTLFRLESIHDFAVIEMGTNHFGEIADLCRIAEPDFGLITNIGHGHTEFLGDVAGVTKAKMELFDYLSTRGTILANLDDPNIAAQRDRYDYEVTYGFTPGVVIQGKDLGTDAQGYATLRVYDTDIRLNVVGAHNLSNALAAVAVGLQFGIPMAAIKAGLESVSLPNKRMQVRQVNGLTIVNDSYNANPESMLAALKTLHAMKSTGKKWLVVGDMLELGEQEGTAHSKIGAALADVDVDGLFAFGKLSLMVVTAAKALKKPLVANHYEDKKELALDLKRMVAPGDIVLLKGSRAMKMEEVIILLEQETE